LRRRAVRPFESLSGALLGVEVTNHCTARCESCLNRIMRRPKGFMEFELFRKIIDEAVRSKQFTQVNLYGLGEPYLHPQFESLAEYAVKACQDHEKTVTIVTNGAVTTRIPEGVGHVDISVNSAVREGYEKLMGQSFARTVANILRLEAEGQLRHNVDIHMLVFEKNASEMEELIRLFGHTSGNIEFSFKYDNQCGRIADLTLERFRSTERIPCHYLLEEVNVTWNGKVILCPHDHEGRVRFGDLRRESIGETWERSMRQEFISAQLRGEYPFICSKCNYNTPTEGRFFRYRAKELRASDAVFLREGFDLDLHLRAKRALRSVLDSSARGRDPGAAAGLRSLLRMPLENNLKAEIALAVLKVDPGAADVLRMVRELALSPENRLEVELARARVLVERGSVEESLASLDRAVETGIPRADPYALAGKCLVSLGRPDEAVARFEKALEFGEDADTIYHHARALRISGKPDQCLAVVERFEGRVETESSHPGERPGTTSARRQSRPTAKSLRLESAGELAGLLELEKAEALLSLGRDHESMEVLKRLAAEYPRLPGVHKVIGLIHARRDRLVEYEAAFIKESEISPEDPEVALHLSRILRSRGRIDEALEQARKAVEAGIEWAHYELGWVLRAKGLHRDAESAFLEEKGETTRAPSRLEAARCRVERGDLQGARDLVLQLLEDDPEAESAGRTVHGELGRLFFRMQDYENAVRELSTELSQAGSSEDLVSELAYSLERCGRASEAIARFEEIAANGEYGPERRAWACFHIGRLNLELGETARAAGAFRSCLEYEPSHGEARRLLNTLRTEVGG